MATIQTITPCLWFDSEAEDAARFYASIFPNSKIGQISRYSDAGKEVHRQPAGKVLVVNFELNGQPFMALNGGPKFKLTPAVSFMVNCDTQQEIDHYWEKLGEGGAPEAQRCGWLADKFGLSWQIIPRALGKLMSDPQRASRVMGALMQMNKLEIAKLEQA
jgi:predicted 3-demethylubiquinone-9 3-methyltransferase (glyoxalase superfamily)